MAGRGAGNVPQLRGLQLRALFVAALVGASLSLASPVTATNFSGATGLTGCYDNNKADSAAHGFFYVSMSPRNASATDWARTYVLDPTDVNTYSDSNTSTTDVLVHDGYYSTLCGFTWYQSPVIARRCRFGSVRFSFRECLRAVPHVLQPVLY